MTDSNVNTVKSLGVVSDWVVEVNSLVNNGIDGDSGLTGLSISNDKLSLTSSNGDLYKLILLIIQKISLINII